MNANRAFLRSGRTAPGRGAFTMVEVIVVMAIIAILMALIIPAVTNAREAARKTQCINNLRNIAIAMTQFDHYNQRLPASGYFHDPPTGHGGGSHHSWAVSLLPFLDQQNVYNRWNFDVPITDPSNEPLTKSYVPVYVCPMDLSRSDDKTGDLSYTVNGGWGFTIRTGAGVGDCPISPWTNRLDLNLDGKTCTGDDEVDDLDRKRFKQVGLFFLENWKAGGTVRHHAIDDILDGTSQTFMITENVRVGFDPDDDKASFASPDPRSCAFYIGSPLNTPEPYGQPVDYSQCNSGPHRINSGLWSPEGSSSVPNSFHPGGVNMAYADGHIAFLNESVDGAVYAALTSPQGMLLDKTLLEQAIVSGAGL